ncbi:MAG TPA: DUF805 domain-containing protein [Microvirga sp.]|nr:DUF805 domain-containing protein [Microvirga sp.]
MDFGQSISTCFSKYATFSGRAPRSEYWWFALFGVLLSFGTQILDLFLGFPVLNLIAMLAVLVPSIAVGVRRLHDTDRSGWWMLLLFIPLIGAIVLLVWFCSRGTLGPNRFGSDPLPASVAVPGVRPAA